ncbi:RNA polymerase-binding transcription factor CarD [Clostridium acetireducens DSM 10703]|uniref:RNA polymerase-binding transcription factor CarD n=1 Tax=Clostridium acetireducens DSM 10703 TaxID=1121290 RepID=A0A1E8F0H1_9CLOT|nr:CarD family transcriptional regulator [Clostridium acetireducens]OFI06920.1 RNA polymerase-binding transcription factor CarD [Clostridium acetireducens DSM 10703]
MLKYGQKVFLKNYGAGLVIDKEYKEYLNKKEEKYVLLYFLLDGIKMHIPIKNFKNYSIRDINTQDDILKNLNKIKTTPDFIEEKWNKRYKQNNKKISTGILEKQCEIIRDLRYLKMEKKLPPVEQKMLKRVQGLVASEISLAFDISLEMSYNKIKTISK